jgi:hypothetical protein
MPTGRLPDLPAGGLDAAEIDAPIGCALARVGRRYDLQNVIDLARDLLPTLPVPTGWRRRRLAPRDFGVSPYFAVIEPTLEAGFDPLTWQPQPEPAGA